MADESELKLNDVSNAVQGLATLLDKDGAMCISWLLTSEWMDSEGNMWFSTHSEPDYQSGERMECCNTQLILAQCNIT